MDKKENQKSRKNGSLFFSIFLPIVLTSALAFGVYQYRDYFKGEAGASGLNGKDGTNGTNGKDGENGKSAYELAVEAGFSGTLEEWLESLKGKDGTSGQGGAVGKSSIEIAVDRLNSMLKTNTTKLTPYERFSEAGITEFNFKNLANFNNEFYYSLQDNKFIAVDLTNYILTGSTNYAKNSVLPEESNDLFKFSYSLTDISTSYANYLCDFDVSSTALNNEITIETSLDVGQNDEAFKFAYLNHSGVAKESFIRTNGGTLTVNAPVDTINHYGEATVLNIEAIDAKNSYHEFGYVPFAQIKTGRVINEVYVKDKAGIQNLFLVAKDSSSFDEIVVGAAPGKSLPALDRTEVTIGDGVKVCEVQTGVTSSSIALNEFIWLFGDGTIESKKVVVTTSTSKPDVETAEVSEETSSGKAAIELANVSGEEKASAADVEAGITLFNGGAGTEKSPFLIASEKDWETLATLSTQNNHDFGVAGYSYKVVNDLDMSYIKSSKDRLKFRLTYFHGTIDFDNHQMTWMTPYNDYPSYLIENSYYGCTIKNANFNLSGRATIIYDYKKEDHMTLIDQNIVLQNINIYGNIVAYNDNNYAPFCSNWLSEGSKLTMENCNNYCNITSSADNTGIFAGRTYGTTTSGVNYYYDIELINCNNYGSLINSNGNAGMLFSNGGPNFNASKVTVKGCENHGTIIGKQNANLICGNLAEKYYDKNNAEYDPENNVEKLDVSNKGNGVCGKANIATLNVENGNFVLPQTDNAAYYVLSFVTTYNDGGGATTGIAYRITEEQRVALELKEYEFSVGEGSNETTGATAIPVGNGTLYVKDEKYLFINDYTSQLEFGRYITRQPAVSFMAFDANGNLLAAYNYTYSN